MILLTGDTHGMHDVFKIEKLIRMNITCESDYLIICGDFGGIWDKNSIASTIAFYSRLKCMVLFVDGNHENFDLLYSYPVEYWNGGKVHKISKNLIHLMRGQIFSLEGKTFFTMGGGTSIDKAWRVEHISWWKEEIPSDEEINEAKRNLELHHNKVDYIITHSCDTKALNEPLVYFEGNKCKAFKDNHILDYFENNIEYKHWYFGHYHVDGEINEKKTVLYQGFRQIGE